MKFDFEKLGDPEYRARIMAQLKEREAERLAAMTPEERAEHDRRRELEEERDQWLGERSTLTNGEIERERDNLEQALDHVEGERDAAKADAEKTHKSLSHALNAWGHTSAKAAHATSSQSGTDRALTEEHQRIAELEATVAKLTEEHQRIAELEATVAKLTEERDAAIRARDEMLKLYLDQQAERGEGGAK